MDAERKAIVFGTLLVLSSLLILVTPMYARRNFGENCISCHTKGGVTLTSNVSSVNVLSSSMFDLQIDAEGDADELTMVWSAAADNPSFVFLPSSVTDNGANDANPQAKNVRGIFAITAPEVQGDYTIQVYAAGGGSAGGVLAIQVSVSTEGPPPANVLPVAYFLYVRRGMTIDFEDQSWDVDGAISSWRWDFGDGTDSIERKPIHTFSQSGTYVVRLTVTDDGGGSNTRSQQFMVPSNQELYQLWILQVFYGSLIIIFTAVFGVGIASSRKKKEGNSQISKETGKVEG